MKSKLSTILVLASVVLIFLFLPHRGNAGLPIPPLPPKLFLPVPPPVIPVPGAYAYFAADTDIDILFHHGTWYRPYGGRWYSSSHYNGPWGFIEVRRVPHVLINLPSDFRRVSPGHERIPYGHLKKNWKTWERDKHWDKKEKEKRKSNGRDRNDHAKSEHGHGRGHGKGH